MPTHTNKSASVETSESSGKRKPGRPKGSKQGAKNKLLDAKHFDGYLKFLNERRNALSKNQTLSFEKLTKQLTKEWLILPLSEKQKYCSNDALHTEASLTGKHKTSKSQQNTRSSASVPSTSKNTRSSRKCTAASSSQDIPIFTDAFLDHNKAKESELHSLNKTNLELEKQNVLLEAHVHNLEDAIVQLESHIESEEARNSSIQLKLRNTQLMFYNAFKDLTNPVTNAKPTIETIEQYMAHVCSLLENNAPEHSLFIAKVYEKVNTLKTSL